MGAKVGVVLSGCGVSDGAEIHESVITLLALDRAGAQAICMAPDIAQLHVVNHATGEVAQGATRNVLEESARIARGQIRNMRDVRAEDIDALILPGGYGAAKNLCDFATKGANAVAHAEITRLVRAMHAAGKPVGFICIAPAIAAAAFRGTPVHPRLTIGTDAETSAALERMGARPVSHEVDEIEVDDENRIVSTPAYMLAGRISEAAAGIEKLVAKVLELAR
ncbi:MAG: isoprenoid biosynthesis glyoxalase ElbB [Deltaproteobacteria bacterium]|nr:isoprenoid biosynthesis glyoxalase ElbB [Deltaproteobacteria bacterium]